MSIRYSRFVYVSQLNYCHENYWKVAAFEEQLRARIAFMNAFGSHNKLRNSTTYLGCLSFLKFQTYLHLKYKLDWANF